jgi:hypothetical protein
MKWLKTNNVHEYVGVLVEVPDDPERQGVKRIILQATDEQEYPVLESHHLNRFLRQRVRIAAKLHEVKGKKVLEVLDVSPIELTGTLD